MIWETHDLVCREAEITKDAAYDGTRTASTTPAVNHYALFGVQFIDDRRYHLVDILDFRICVCWWATMDKVFEVDIT